MTDSIPWEEVGQQRNFRHREPVVSIVCNRLLNGTRLMCSLTR
jgi:hypothetical protein